MKTLLSLGLCIGLASLPITSAAKTCECKKHSAEASGRGTCTRTETETLCSINYTGRTANSTAVANGFDIEQMSEFAAFKFDSQIPIHETFRVLNEINFQSIDESTFRSLMVNTLVLMSPSENYADSLLRSLDFSRSSIFPGSDPVRELFEEFTRTGCAEANIGKAIGDDAEYLIIHIRSEANGTCSE